MTYGMSLTSTPLDRERLRDHVLVTIWFFVTFKQFRYDELILYPLALYFAWAFIRDFNLIFPIMMRSLLLLAFPLWWMLSALWGIETGLILKSGAQMFLTVMICYAAIVRLNERDLILSMIIVATWFAILSFLVTVSGSGLAARGVFSSKNTMGMAMVILWLASLCVLLDTKRQWWLRLGAIGAALLAAFQITVANSATAVLLAAGVTVSVLIVGGLPKTGLLKHPVFVGLLMALTAVIFFLAASFLSYNTVAPTTLVLEAFGKDASLTGRTDLWRYAIEQIKEAPLLGVGAGGFWTPLDGSTPARRIYDEFYKAYYATFSFHNAYFEITVHQGLIGLGIVITTVFWMLWRLGLDVVARNSIPTTFFVTIGFVNLASSMTESALFTPFSLLSVLFTMGAFLSVKNSRALRDHVHSYQRSVPVTS